MAEKMWYDWLASILLIVGGINWGLVGAFKWNLVEAIFGVGTFAMVVYVLVGVAGLMALWKLVKK
jgi:uncharacterized membrane protein YuzA (DUF378 family)